MLTTKKSREEMFISTSTKPKAWVRPRAINQNVKSMTKNEIKELTDIIMKADVYSVFKGGRIDKSKRSTATCLEMTQVHGITSSRLMQTQWKRRKNQH